MWEVVMRKPGLSYLKSGRNHSPRGDELPTSKL